MTLFKDIRPRKRRVKDGYGRAQRAVIAAIAEELNRHTIPPMDRGLRSIVAQQVRNLLVGGWPLGLVKKVAIELALAWDEKRGHNRLTHLQARVRLIDAASERVAHEARKRDVFIDPRILKILVRGRSTEQSRPHPSTHPFKRSERPNTCSLCDGPIGVHVRAVGLDDEGNQILVTTDLLAEIKA